MVSHGDNLEKCSDEILPGDLLDAGILGECISRAFNSNTIMKAFDKNIQDYNNNLTGFLSINKVQTFAQTPRTTL